MIGRKYAHKLTQPLVDLEVRWRRDIDVWLPEIGADPSLHVMGPAHTDGSYTIRYINEKEQLTEPVWTSNNQSVAKGDLQEALNYLALDRATKTVPGTNTPIEWSEHNRWAQQHEFIDPMRFLELAGAPLGGFSVPSIKAIETGLESGNALEALWLDVDVDTNKVFKHEGRHRAYYAWKQGWPQVPVILWHYQKNIQGFMRYTEVKDRIPISSLRSEARRVSAADYAREGILWDPEASPARAT